MNKSGLSDIEIWNALKKGNKYAISYIYSKYSKNLYLYGLKITSNRELIEDTLHDLFTEIINNRKKLGNTDNILFYLLASFKRKLLRKIQSEKKFSYNTLKYEYHFDVTWSIEHKIISNETNKKTYKILSDALKKLTPRQKEAIYLRFTKELDYKSISKIMDISIESCRNIISKAITSLKKQIDNKKKFFILLFSFLNQI